ncbi:hypothetical protein HAX54_037194 [Datura stramonium]|uniref:Uncharacterized protein n=1 Tax=Datura stramonium TaxID=4076 RepID=A0ABS8VJ88_DATST|nr:hypothetical protein [Datura stramonium]
MQICVDRSPIYSLSMVSSCTGHQFLATVVAICCKMVLNSVLFLDPSPIFRFEDRAFGVDEDWRYFVGEPWWRGFDLQSLQKTWWRLRRSRLEFCR